MRYSYLILIIFTSIVTIRSETCTLSSEAYTASLDSVSQAYVSTTPTAASQCPGGLQIGVFQGSSQCRLQGVAMESTSDHQFELTNIINLRTQMLSHNHTMFPSGSTSDDFGASNANQKALPEVASGEGHRFVKTKITLGVDAVADLQRYQSCSVINLQSDLARYTGFVPHGDTLGYCWMGPQYSTNLMYLKHCAAYKNAKGAATVRVGECSSSDISNAVDGCDHPGVSENDARHVKPFKAPNEFGTIQKSNFESTAIGGNSYIEINSQFREEGTCSYTKSDDTAVTLKGLTKEECIGYCDDHTSDVTSCPSGTSATLPTLSPAVKPNTVATWSTDLDYSCEFIIQNNMYVGTLKLGLAFEKTANTVGVGGKVLTKIIVPIKVTPGLNDPNFFDAAKNGYIEDSFQNQQLRDLVISYDRACISPGGYLVRDRYGADNQQRSTTGGMECDNGHPFKNGVNKDDDDKVHDGSSASTGTVSLKLTGVFLDKRYKIVSQSGTETLTTSMGDFLMLKQGMDLHRDYRSFNDINSNINTNGADNTINLSPIDFRYRKLAASSIRHVEDAENGGSSATYKDFSNKGAPLNSQSQPRLQIYKNGVANYDGQRFKADTDADDDISDLSDADIQAAYRCETDNGNSNDANRVYYSYETEVETRGECHAQYLLSHTFTFTYGDLPHFKPSYLACDLCDSLIAIKGFKESDGANERYQINTKLAVSIPNLPTSPETISLKAVSLKEKTSQFKLQPSLYYKMSSFFDVEEHDSSDLVKADGTALTSLDDDLKFDEFFSFATKDAKQKPIPTTCDTANQNTECGSGLCKATAIPNDSGNGFIGVCDNIMKLNDGTPGDTNNCQSLKTLKVYQLKTDTREGFADIFDTECYIQVPGNYYGSTYDIVYKNTQTADNQTSTTQVKEIDQRKILISNPENDESTTLTLTERVKAQVSRVATTITMEFIKELPSKQIPSGLQHPATKNLADQYITFRLRGDSSALSGYISTSKGGAECAADTMYWMQSSYGRIYKNVFTHTERTWTATTCSDGGDVDGCGGTVTPGSCTDNTITTQQDCVDTGYDSNKQGYQYYPDSEAKQVDHEERIQAEYLNDKPFGTCAGSTGLNMNVLSHDCGGNGGDNQGANCKPLDETKCTAVGGQWKAQQTRCYGGTYSSGTWDAPSGYNSGDPYQIKDSSAELVTYRQCQEHGGKWQIVSMPDATFAQVGSAYQCTGKACGSSLVLSNANTCGGTNENQCDYLGYDSRCSKPAVQEEILFTTSRVNGDSKSHLIQSTGDCTGTLDFQLEDTTANQEFAIYKARIDCSRVSSQLLTDKVVIQYKYATTLDLSANSLEIDAIHSANVNGNNAEGACTFPSFRDLTREKCVGECVDSNNASLVGISPAQNECDLQGSCTNPNIGIGLESDCTGLDADDDAAVWKNEGYNYQNGVFTPTYEVSAYFGTCDDSNEIVPPDGGFNSGNCTKNSDYKFVSDDDTKLQLKDNSGNDVSNGLQTLIDCAKNGGVVEDINRATVPARASYIITYQLAMQYVRKTHNEGAFGAKLTYCDDQTFTATIDRDATATVTAAQIKAAGLNRAVIVQDIGWIGSTDVGSECNQDFYRLEILMKARDSDARGSTWVDSKLSRAMIDTASTARNPNGLTIYASGMKTIVENPETVKSMPARCNDPAQKTENDCNGNWDHDNDANTAEVARVWSPAGDAFMDKGNVFKVRGACIKILECSETDNNMNGDSWYDFSKQFVTDLVIRGEFLESPVDTKIQMTLNFRECPVTQTAAVTGDLRVGLRTECTDRQNPITGFDRVLHQSIAQPNATKHVISVADIQADDPQGLIYDCTSAFPDDVLRVSGFPFATVSGCDENEGDPNDADYDAACGLYKSEYDKAKEQGWDAQEVEVWIDRFDTSQGDAREVSRTKLCECNALSTDTYKCSVVGTNIANLDAFVTTASVNTAGKFKHYIACGTHGTQGKDSGKAIGGGDGQINGNTLIAEGNDLWKHQIGLMPLSAASADQFVIRYEVILQSSLTRRRRRLRATQPIRVSAKLKEGSASASGHARGIKVMEFNNAVPVVTAATTAAPTAATTAAPTEEDEINWLLIGLLIGGGVLLVGGGIAAFFLCKKKDEDGNAEESESLTAGDQFRERRFSNLRY